MSFSQKQSSLILPYLLRSSIQKTLQTKYLLLTTKTASLKKRRTGVFTSCVNASLTVEASMILTIFLIISYCIIYPFFILNIQINLQSIVENITKKDAQYAYCSFNNYEIENIMLKMQYGELINTEVNLDTVKGQVQSSILQENLFLGVINNINYEDSHILDDNENIDLVLHYQVRIPFPINHVENLVVRSRKRAWIGKGDFSNKEGETSKFVYMAENGKVYHLYEDCTYLKLSIHAVNYEEVYQLRNDEGGIYYACEHCRPQSYGTVYITDDGNRYHSSLLCSGLKRKISKVSIDDIGSKPLCSRCRLRSDK